MRVRLLLLGLLVAVIAFLTYRTAQYSRIDQPPEMRGIQVSMAVPDAPEGWLLMLADEMQALRDQGLRADVLYESTTAAALQALVNGRADFAVARARQIAQAIADGERFFILGTIAAPRLNPAQRELAFLVVSKYAQQTRPGVSRRVLAALLRAEALTHSRPSRAVALIAQQTGSDESLVAQLLAEAELHLRFDADAVALLRGLVPPVPADADEDEVLSLDQRLRPEILAQLAPDAVVGIPRRPGDEAE